MRYYPRARQGRPDVLVFFTQDLAALRNSQYLEIRRPDRILQFILDPDSQDPLPWVERFRPLDPSVNLPILRYGLTEPFLVSLEDSRRTVSVPPGSQQGDIAVEPMEFYLMPSSALPDELDDMLRQMGFKP